MKNITAVYKTAMKNILTAGYLDKIILESTCLCWIHVVAVSTQT